MKTNSRVFLKVLIFGLLCSCRNIADPTPDFGSFYQTLPKFEHFGNVYLLGEAHGVQNILDKEFVLWNSQYLSGSRNLFIEMPFFTAEYLNLWMKETDDKILNAVYEDWKGSSAYNPIIYDFYKRIKNRCPETIFHGTDVGHQYWSTGKRFIDYLESNNLKMTKIYSLTQEAIEQGIKYYINQDAVYRENTMVTNFCRELNQLNNQEVVGIYGAAHIGKNSADFTNQVPSMANQLVHIYGDIFLTQDLRN